MVKYNFWHKIIVFVNSISSILLLLSYLLPFISPKTVPILTIVSIAVPVLFIANVFFCDLLDYKIKKILYDLFDFNSSRFWIHK